MLTIFKGFAMLGSCTNHSVGSAARYQRNPDHVVLFFKSEIVGSVVILKAVFFDIRGFVLFQQYLHRLISGFLVNTLHFGTDNISRR